MTKKMSVTPIRAAHWYRLRRALKEGAIKLPAPGDLLKTMKRADQLSE